jgi:aspartate racemase
LAIACNTAHHYFDQIANSVHIPVLNMVDLMVGILLKEHPGLLKIGLLTSPATRITKLYEKNLPWWVLRQLIPIQCTRRTLLN